LPPSDRVKSISDCRSLDRISPKGGGGVDCLCVQKEECGHPEEGREASLPIKRVRPV